MIPCVDCAIRASANVYGKSCKTDPCSCSCHTAPPINFEARGAELGHLVDVKQAAYGDSFGKSGQVMRILYPAGVAAEQLDDALTVVRILDKLFRVATSRDALGESPFRDIGGYALHAQARVDRSKKPPTAAPEPK